MPLVPSYIILMRWRVIRKHAMIAIACEKLGLVLKCIHSCNAYAHLNGGWEGGGGVVVKERVFFNG